uniref:hypothetical protein n=1 Tax=Helicobacter pylori TaxID=210 RepID=UPI0015E860B2|nr:hypothetical protein [Helicobacter pylori]
MSILASFLACSIVILIVSICFFSLAALIWLGSSDLTADSMPLMTASRLSLMRVALGAGVLFYLGESLT